MKNSPSICALDPLLPENRLNAVLNFPLNNSRNSHRQNFGKITSVTKPPGFSRVSNECKTFGNSFELLSVEGLCTLVPPSYIEKFAERHRGTYSFLKKREDKWKQIQA